MTTLEQKRLDLLAKLDAKRSQAERNRMGQFGTPSALASEVMRTALALMPEGERVRFLEPGFGTGAFYSALLDQVPAKRIEAAEGFEIDAHYGDEAVRLWKGTLLALHQRDFLTTPPPAEHERFNLLISNPPYIRHHHIDAERKPELQHMAALRAGLKLSGLSGLYCYFMAAAHTWMREGGIGVWLIPSEFMDVNYGAELKRYLLRDVTLLRIHRFDPDEVQFEDALVSSAIVILKKEHPSPQHSVEFTFGGTLTEPRVRKSLPAAQLAGEQKWTRFPVNGQHERPRHVLSDFFAIKRGIATGGNEFFVLPAEEIARRRLPRQFFRPILPGPRWLQQEVIESDAEGVPVLDRSLFVLDCSLPETEVRRRFPALADYLDEGVRNGYRDRYLCSRRTPWYSQEQRPAPSYFCTYIGRANTKSGRPFRFIQNNSQAIAANTYLLLYAKPELASALEANPALKAEVWRILNDIPLETLVLGGRVYGGGLHKLEPKELAQVNADELAELVNAQPRASGRTVAMQAELSF
ncbi:MAG: Eco57I restriction-modification methylase domain-containing protein [Verrucomicrobiaceae bacterium]|nr:Eco57I restriction-modification methylase domain-containing protein [Verrucomicrobiaceae bacterium]